MTDVSLCIEFALGSFAGRVVIANNSGYREKFCRPITANPHELVGSAAESQV